MVSILIENAGGKLVNGDGNHERWFLLRGPYG
jgi:hypothetical protein